MNDITPEELEEQLKNLRPPTPSALDGRVTRLLHEATGREPAKAAHFVPRIIKLAGGIAAACVLGVLGWLVFARGHDLVPSAYAALDEAIKHLEQVVSVRVDIIQRAVSPGTGHENVPGLKATIWNQGEKAFLDFPDRKVWRDGNKTVTYYPDSGRVVVSHEQRQAEESSAIVMNGTGSKALAEWLRGLEAHGFHRASYAKETVNGRSYQRINVPPTNTENMELVLFVDAKEQRLDYLGWRKPGVQPASQYDIWMAFTYNPVISPDTFMPKYPEKVEVQRYEQPPDKEQTLRLWRNLAISRTESNDFEAGILEAWLTPDGWLALHMFVANEWPSGTAFPSDIFGPEEMKGGFDQKAWDNKNILLEWPAGIPRAATWRLGHEWEPGAGISLHESYYGFPLAEPIASEVGAREATLHVWMLKQPSHPMDWRKGYTKEKANYVYCTLRVPIPEKPTPRPSEQFTLGLSHSYKGRPNSVLRLRLWTLERNQATPQEALDVIDAHPEDVQYEVRWEKLKLLKALGRQDEIDAFLRNCLPYVRKADPKLGASNAQRIIDEYGSPKLRDQLAQ